MASSLPRSTATLCGASLASRRSRRNFSDCPASSTRSTRDATRLSGRCGCILAMPSKPKAATKATKAHRALSHSKGVKDKVKEKV